MFQLIKSPSYWKSRKGFKPEAIVIHITDGNRKSVINTFLNSKNQVSAHYLVCKDGDIIQFVDEKYPAWHSGYIKNPKWGLLKLGINPNLYTIGLEFEGFDDEQLTLTQLIIGSWLLFKVSASWGIPLDQDHIIPHNLVRADKICPGKGVSIGYLIRLAKILKNN